MGSIVHAQTLVGIPDPARMGGRRAGVGESVRLFL
jgi:hypothetical protein